jgi:hypothetical protein
MSTWQIRNVKFSTRKKIKLYAIQHELTTAQALDKIIELALKK